jgi:hypothetical protein
MKHIKITPYGIMICILSYAIICSRWPRAAIPLILLPKIIMVAIPLLLVAVLIKAYKYYSQKNKP